MPVPKHEAVLQALLARLQTLTATFPGLEVERNEAFPDRVNAAGEIILRDGTPGEPEVLFSPLTYEYEHQAVVEVMSQGDDQAARDLQVATIMQAIGAVIDGDPTLGGLVDHCEAGLPDDMDTIPIRDAEPIKVASLPVTLLYTTTSPLA
jgi:hypothetical protein